MIGAHWEQIKEAFWRAVEDGVDSDGALTRESTLDDAARAELRALIDEHRRLATADIVASQRGAADPAGLSDRFDVLEHLGSGAFGDVYRVFDRTTGSIVALKVLREAGSSALYYFKREFRALADIRHPNIAALLELILHEGRWMFTMEFIDGTSIRRYVEGGLASEREPRLRECFLQLAIGLHALHERQLLHRDLKPSNVLIARDGRAVILDFGLAHPFSPGERRHATLAGTPEYMSPEQIGGQPLTQASDWYAFGVMLYEALTGRLPFEGSLLSLLQRKQSDAAAPPAALAMVPPDLNDLSVGLLATEPLARYGFADVSRLLGRPAPGVATRTRSLQLIGREEELRLLNRAYDSVRNGQPAIVHISGSSGIGKTSLIREFVSQLEGDRSVLALEGRCFESESVPYQGLDDLVDHLSQHMRRLDPDALEQILPRNFGVLTRMFPVLGHLRASEPRANLPVDSYELRRLGFAALGELLGRLAERSRLVLTIDDLQWGADCCSFFENLLTPLGAPAVLLLLSYRTEAIRSSPELMSLRDPSTGALAAISTHIELDRLEASAAKRLVQILERPGVALSQAAIEQVEDQSGGEPFLIHEIMRWVNVRGSAGALASPFSLADVIRARMLDMGDDTLHLLQLVAIAGQPIARTIIHAALPSPTFVGSRDRLLHERLIRSQLVQGREMLEIYHDRLRSVLVTLIGTATVVERHLELAEAFERTGSEDAEQAALHFHAAGDPARAATHALRAAERAVEAFAFGKAASLYRLALAGETLEPDSRRNVYRSLGDALSNADKGAEAATAYLSAAEGATEHDAIRLRASAASQLLRCGHIQRGIAMLEALVRQTGVTVMRTHFGRLCHVGWLRARLQVRGLRFRERPALELSEDMRIRLDVCWIGAVGTGMIEPLRSAEFSAQYVLLALKSGDPLRILLALAGESTQICHVPSGGDPRKSFALLARAGEMAERIGDPYAKAFTIVMKCIVSFLHGDWRGASALGDAASERLRAGCTNVAWEQSTASIIAFNARALCGDWQSNRERLPGLIKDAEDRGDLHASLSLRLIGTAHLITLADDEPERARLQLRQDLAAWPHEQYDLQKACGLQGEIDISLYLERPGDAWEKVLAEWPLLRQSQLLRVPTMFVFMHYAHARAALALASSGGPDSRLRSQLLAAAAADARAVHERCAKWSAGLVELARAGIATFGHDVSAVRTHLLNAEHALREADLTGFAMAASWRRSAYEPPDLAGRLRGAAADWAASRGVKRVDRLVTCLAPGRYQDTKTAPAAADGPLAR